MSKITYNPKNNAYFKNLLEFLQELLPICESLNIKPIIYGSLAYGYYSRDESININDIDVLIPESFFQEISKQATSKGFSYEETNYHSLKIYKDGLKIAFDDIEYYYGKTESLEVNFNSINIRIIPLYHLIDCYERGAKLIPVKSAEYLNKLTLLTRLN